MVEPIDTALAARLDAFTAPPLPAGFAERLVATAAAMPVEAALPLPRLRPSQPRRWLRGGAAGLGALALGMISISAAAMGYLGEPIRHAVSQAPVIGTVVERVIPKALRERGKPAPVKLAQPAAPPSLAATTPAALEEAQPAAPLTPMERRERMRAIMADPEKRAAWMEAHPVAAQRIERRIERAKEIRTRRIEAGLPVRPQPEAGTGAPLPDAAMPRFQRHERRERLRELRRLRIERRGLEQRGMLPDRIDEPAAGEAQP